MGQLGAWAAGKGGGWQRATSGAKGQREEAWGLGLATEGLRWGGSRRGRRGEWWQGLAMSGDGATCDGEEVELEGNSGAVEARRWRPTPLPKRESVSFGFFTPRLNASLTLMSGNEKRLIYSLFLRRCLFLSNICKIKRKDIPAVPRFCF